MLTIKLLTLLSLFNYYHLPVYTIVHSKYILFHQFSTDKRKHKALYLLAFLTYIVAGRMCNVNVV